MSRCFAALNAGPGGITAVAAQWNKNGDYMLKGVCRVRSKGFGKGTVADAAMAVNSVSEVIGKLKADTGKKIQDVYAGLSSASIGVIPSSGILLLSKYGREISESDIKKCVQVGSTVKIPLDREPLHRIVSGFSIDGEKEIQNPLNLEGVKMGVNVKVLTIKSSIIRNMSKCIADAGFIPAGFVFSGIASAYRALSDEDREAGVALMDISEDMTEIMVFYRGRLTCCKVMPFGTAEISHGNGSIDKAKLEELVRPVISAEEWEKIRRVVVIGEGVLIEDMIESLEEIFNSPVIVGTCAVRPFEELPPGRAEYISSLGILDYLKKERSGQYPAANMVRNALNNILGFLDRYF